MKNRKISIVLAFFSLLCITGCNESPTEETSFVVTPKTYRVASYRLELSNSVLREGTTFYDGANPVLYKGGSLYEQKITYTIKKGSVSYSAGDRLGVGSYSFEVKTNTMNNDEIIKGTFEVKSSRPIKGEEGKGYHTLSDKEVSDTAVSNYKFVGSLGEGKTASKGSPNLLVIPLYFDGDNLTFSNNELNKIEKAYFGKAEETSWESVTSYYEKSSYGKLKFQGKVVAPYRYPSSSVSVEKAFLAGRLSVNDIVERAVKEVLSRDNINPIDYDINSDGYLDGIEIIYKTTQSMTEETTSLWWCFTSSLHAEPNKDAPVTDRYFWSLYSQIETPYYPNSIDAHTIVHETGHMLGLNDYYDYDSKSIPVGAVDMMDRNIGDHSAYSKYLLGWVNPKIIDGSASDFQITLSSFTDTGDCVILRNTISDPFNGTPYDEYLMLSYLTPTGVNLQDSKGYAEYSYKGGYKKSGLQLTHIDNRMISFEGSEVSAEGYLDYSKAAYTDELTNEEEIQTIDGKNILTKSPSFTMASNTASQSYAINSDGNFVGNSKYKEITLVPANKSTSFLSSTDLSAMGSQANLFGLSSYGCGSSYFSNYAYKGLFPNETAWNDGSQNNFVFEVLSQSDSAISIRFIKNF